MQAYGLTVIFQTCIWPWEGAFFLGLVKGPPWVLQKGSACNGSHEGCAKKRSGNSAPHKRIPFPEVSQDALDKAMHSYCRAMGIKEAFNMYQYKNLQAQQSESPQSIAQLARLLEALLGVSSSAKIKYKALKQSFVVLLQTWGVQLLKAHWEMDDSMLAGRAADSVGVLLKHWRRCSSSEVAWGKLVGKLDESEAAALERLRKKTTWDGKQEPKKRQLKLHNSEGAPLLV